MNAPSCASCDRPFEVGEVGFVNDLGQHNCARCTDLTTLCEAVDGKLGERAANLVADALADALDDLDIDAPIPYWPTGKVPPAVCATCGDTVESCACPGRAVRS